MNPSTQNQFENTITQLDLRGLEPGWHYKDLAIALIFDRSAITFALLGASSSALMIFFLCCNSVLDVIELYEHCTADYHWFKLNISD